MYFWRSDKKKNRPTKSIWSSSSSSLGTEDDGSIIVRRSSQKQQRQEQEQEQQRYHHPTQNLHNQRFGVGGICVNSSSSETTCCLAYYGKRRHSHLRRSRVGSGGGGSGGFFFFFLWLLRRRQLPWIVGLGVVVVICSMSSFWGLLDHQQQLSSITGGFSNQGSQQQQPRRQEYHDITTKKKNLGVIVLLAPPRNLGSLWNIDRFCFLLRAVRSIDQHLNIHFGPYPIMILIANDYYPKSNHQDQHQDGPYTFHDRKLLQEWAPHSTILFQEINLYSGLDALGTINPNKHSMYFLNTTTTTTTTTITTPSDLITKWRQGYDGSVPGRDLGYTSMCRLWSGRLQQMEFLQDYIYYMRMDDDSLLVQDLEFDPFLRMQHNNLTYVYRRDAFDHWGVTELWQIVKPHIIKAIIPTIITTTTTTTTIQQAEPDNDLQDDNDDEGRKRRRNNTTNSNSSSSNSVSSLMAVNLPFVDVAPGSFDGNDDFDMDSIDDNDESVVPIMMETNSDNNQNSPPSFLDDVEYLGRQPYNNFHISKVSFWTSPSWLAVWDDLNDHQVFFKYRVGDANVHAIALMMMGNGMYQKWTQFPYVHNSNDMHEGWGSKAWQNECQQAYYNNNHNSSSIL